VAGVPSKKNNCENELGISSYILLCHYITELHNLSTGKGYRRNTRMSVMTPVFAFILVSWFSVLILFSFPYSDLFLLFLPPIYSICTSISLILFNVGDIIFLLN
jgi:hypothetical protein